MSGECQGLYGPGKHHLPRKHAHTIPHRQSHRWKWHSLLDSADGYFAESDQVSHRLFRFFGSNVLDLKCVGPGFFTIQMMVVNVVIGIEDQIFSSSFHWQFRSILYFLELKIKEANYNIVPEAEVIIDLRNSNYMHYPFVSAQQSINEPYSTLNYMLANKY